MDARKPIVDEPLTESIRIGRQHLPRHDVVTHLFAWLVQHDEHIHVLRGHAAVADREIASCPQRVYLHGEKRGLRAEVMLASVAMYQEVSVLAALPICAIYVLQHRVTGAPFTDSQSLVGLLLVCLLIPLALLLANPNWLTSLCNWGLRLLKRPPLQMLLTRRGLLGCIAATVASWLLWGGAFATLVPGVLAPESLNVGAYPLLPGLLYAYPIAHAAGMASLLTPTGLGVREGVFTWLATPILGSSAALVAVLAMRLWTTLAEVLMALLAYVGLRDD